MTFTLRMAARETRAGWRRLLFFFLCIAIGVGAMAALRSAVQNVRAALEGQARTLLGADIVLSSSRELPDAARQAVDRLGEGGILGRTLSVETATMVRPADDEKAVARIVELRGVEAAFPLRGTLTLTDGRPYTHAMLESGGALVRPELLVQLGLQVGDRLLIGERPFTIRGAIQAEPGRRASGFSFGPRVLIDYEALQQLGLLTFGSRARREILLTVDERRVDAFTRQLREELSDTFVSVRSFRTMEDDMGEDLARAEDYLSLAGLTVLILGGIGVSSVTRVFIDQKMKSIAVLKCLGARTRTVAAIYVVQVVALGAAGSALGLLLGGAALSAVPRDLFVSPDGAPIAQTLTGSAMLQAAAVGVLVSLLFSVVPLLRLRYVKPSLLLRAEEGIRVPVDWRRAAAVLVVGAALAALATWQAGSWQVGLGICLGFGVLASVLYGAGALLVHAVRPLTRSPRFAVRHAALHLIRPGSQTRVVLLAVGLGVFVLVGIRAVEGSLFREFAVALDEDAPDLFLVDIQADQRRAAAEIVAAHTKQPPRLIPVLRARVTQVRGRETNLDSIEDVRGRGSLGREYTITYRTGLEANEEVIEGVFWPASPSPEPEVSIEESIQERFRINPGDTIRFDVLGRAVTARVTSVRKVEWRDGRAGGFMFVFRPGVFDQAPHSYIAPVRGPSDPAARARLQRDLAAALPNVSVIDVREILGLIRSVVDKVALAVSVIGGLVLGAGVLILVGAVAVTKYRRLKDAAILKTLGASSRQVGSLLLIEYSALGAIAGVIGALGGAGLSWGLSRYVLEIDWSFPLREILAGVALTALLVAGVGLAASLDVLRRKPLATLRAE